MKLERKEKIKDFWQKKECRLVLGGAGGKIVNFFEKKLSLNVKKAKFKEFWNQHLFIKIEKN